MAKNASPGTCALCGHRSSKAGMVRHVGACAAAHEVSKGTPVRLFHLRAEGAYAPMFWLDLEMKADATLKRLDRFLRDIWLECCGHLSAFRIDRATYTIPIDHTFDDFREERSMNYKIGEVLRPNCMDEGGAFYCAAHLKEHECDEEDVWLPVVNSPRMGTCGYTGAG